VEQGAVGRERGGGLGTVIGMGMDERLCMSSRHGKNQTRLG
jgi:hypothetical protein